MSAPQLSLLQLPERNPYITGDDYRACVDEKRLNTQYSRIVDLMEDGVWRTFDEIQTTLEPRYSTIFPQASISAQLRHANKAEWKLEKRRRGDAERGLYEYRLVAR